MNRFCVVCSVLLLGVLACGGGYGSYESQISDEMEEQIIEDSYDVEGQAESFRWDVQSAKADEFYATANGRWCTCTNLPPGKRLTTNQNYPL